MKTEQVRCWRTGPHGELFITYPEGDMGHRLICCASCGKVYSVNVTKQLYIEPELDVHLSATKCIECGQPLSHNWLVYPDQHLGSGGSVCTFVRELVIPPDSESIIEHFPEIFS
jgi:DNA-directed RNA polymerase subunit N (RpoN/RPB10)